MNFYAFTHFPTTSSIPEVEKQIWYEFWCATLFTKSWNYLFIGDVWQRKRFLSKICQKKKLDFARKAAKKLQVFLYVKKWRILNNLLSVFLDLRMCIRRFISVIAHVFIPSYLLPLAPSVKISYESFSLSGIVQSSDFSLDPAWDLNSKPTEIDVQFFFQNIFGYFEEAVQYNNDNSVNVFAILLFRDLSPSPSFLSVA